MFRVVETFAVSQKSLNVIRTYDVEQGVYEFLLVPMSSLHCNCFYLAHSCLTVLQPTNMFPNYSANVKVM